MPDPSPIDSPSSRTSRALVRLACLCALTTPALIAADAGSLAATRDTYKEYIEIRKIIGDESTAWTTQRETLVDMIAVLESEVRELEGKMTALASSATSADQKRAELNGRLETGRATSKAFDDTIAALEGRVRALSARLPDPLTNELKPLLARLPETSGTTRLSYSQRLQSVIGILAQTDKFNADVKYVSAVQDVGGESREVQTLYFGLAAALFTDGAGKYAGYGSPGDAGWQWQTVTGEQAAAVAKAVNVYLSRQSPEFVTVPLKAD